MAYVVAVCPSPKAGCLGKVTAEKIYQGSYFVK